MRATLVRGLTVIGSLAVCSAAAASLAPHKTIRPADQARARKVLLTLADFPSGWKTEKTSPDNSSPTSSKCAKGLSDLTETADVEREFGRSALGLIVDSAVGMLKTRAEADVLWKRVPTERSLACSAQSGSGLPKGTHVTFQKLVLPLIGDRSVAWRFTITSTSLPSPLHADIVFANKGRTFSVLTLADLGSSFDRKLERRLAVAMGNRLDRYAA
jgi:hypothetical protein